MDQGISGKKLYKTVGVEAEILCRWRMRYGSGKVDWGHTVLSLDCQIKEYSLFARLSGATDNFASREWQTLSWQNFRKWFVRNVRPEAMVWLVIIRNTIGVFKCL